MTTLPEKVRAVLPMLLKHGNVYLLALFEREDVSEKWDVMLSSDWSDRDSGAAVKAISQTLVPLLAPQELTSLSRIVAIRSAEPAVSAISDVHKVTGESVSVKECNFMGLRIKNAIIFQSQRPALKMVAQEASINS